MHTYKEEVARKRRNARIFWVMVLLFATMLYFFFQGKYLNIGGWWNHLFVSYTGTTVSGEQPALIRSFGIVNVRTNPTESTIWLGSGTLSYNEAKTVDYGKYTLAVWHNGYLPTETISFTIDESKQFFIENIKLLPTPSYKAHRGIIDAYAVNNTDILIRTSSGILMSSGLVATGKVLLPPRAIPIGDRYFKNGRELVAWESGTFKRQERELENFVNTCDGVVWEYGFFYCPSAHSLITEDSEYFTGVLDVHDGMFLRQRTLINYKNRKIEKYPLDGSGAIALNHLAILDEQVYTQSGTSLIDEKGTSLLTLPLENIRHSNSFGDERVFIGSIEERPHIVISNKRDPADRIRIVELPTNVDYIGVTTHTLGGNIVIEARNAILFIYRASTRLNWLVEGTIRAYFPTGALYERDGVIWSAMWQTEK